MSRSGGRGGTNYVVTNLNWDSADTGSLLYAIKQTGARTVTFNVSGTIDATGQNGFSDIINGNSFDDLTILGMTAPAPGITILTNEFRFRDCDNIIMLGLTFRKDATYSSPQSPSGDVVWMLGVQDMFTAYCSFSHGSDEAGSWASNGASQREVRNITVQNCIFSNSDTGNIIGTNLFSGDFSFINNVYSGVSHRFPNHKGYGRADIIGNVIYNWKERLVRLGDLGIYNGETNVINNYCARIVTGKR